MMLLPLPWSSLTEGKSVFDAAAAGVVFSEEESDGEEREPVEREKEMGGDVGRRQRRRLKHSSLPLQSSSKESTLRCYHCYRPLL
ncbi:hypothetical protein PIB30_083688, partial [Stylosanthes scabra]|nr:hypothetical protein [Stylosanthes scabra]